MKTSELLPIVAEPTTTVMWEVQTIPVLVKTGTLYEEAQAIDQAAAQMMREGWEVISVLPSATHKPQVLMVCRRPMIGVRFKPTCDHLWNAVSINGGSTGGDMRAKCVRCGCFGA